MISFMSQVTAPLQKGNPAPRPKTLQPKTGVKVEPAPHKANPIYMGSGVTAHGVTTVKQLIQGSCSREFKKLKDDHIIQSSFEEEVNENSPALSARNGFVNGAVLAYNHHHHLIIRPEDIWFSILGQLNLYINANAEDLRHMFVAHEGKKKLDLMVGVDPMDGKKGTMFGIDWASFGWLMGKKLAENIVDPSLREWFLPAFSTTTKVDEATASIMLMSSMQKYFEYSCSTCCGLPSVTLLGRQKDWEKMLSRLERLETFGEEPARFGTLLQPILKKFIETFDDPDSEEIREFWQRIAHYVGGGSGPTYLSGWITAFCFWDVDGKCMHQPGSNPSDKDTTYYGREKTMVLDGARYHLVDTSKIPPGYATVPVELNDNGFITNAEMVAGSLGMMVSSSGLELAEGKEGKYDTIQPTTGWCMYEIYTPEELEARLTPEERERKRRWGY